MRKMVVTGAANEKETRNEKEALLQALRGQGVSEELLAQTEAFCRTYDGEAEETRTRKQQYVYDGREVWEEAIAALLCGENLLLCGSKATGKNVLAENLAVLFGRPSFNVSFHINMDASYLIGSDTYENGAVRFRPGPVTRAAQSGGFCILDEINMARNEALAVLHEVLDFRRVINVPGYSSIEVSPAARFLATMNYGYAGTRELNEALASRFVIIQAPEMTTERMDSLLKRTFPDLVPRYREAFTGLFSDIQKKCVAGELSARPLDLRGLLDAIRLMQMNLAPRLALDMGITNKTFDSYERSLVRDIIASRIPEKAAKRDLFEA